MTPEEVLHLLRMLARQDIIIGKLGGKIEELQAEIARLNLDVERLSE